MLTEGLGEVDTLEVEQRDSLPLTVDVEETVVDGDRDADLVRERVTVPVDEREEDPDAEGLREGLGEDDILEVEHLESVPLTVDEGETVPDGDRDVDLVCVEETVADGERDADLV